MNFDTEIIASSYDLINFLSDKGLGWFIAFDEVNTCMVDGHIQITLKCPYEEISPAIEEFCGKYGFSLLWFDDYMGRITLARVKPTPELC